MTVAATTTGTASGNDRTGSESAGPALFLSAEFFFVCAIIGVPLHAVPGIGAYSALTYPAFMMLATLAALPALSRAPLRLPPAALLVLAGYLAFLCYVLASLLRVTEPEHIGLRKVAMLSLGGTWSLAFGLWISADDTRLERFLVASLAFGTLFAFLNLALPAAPTALGRTALSDNYQHAARATGLAAVVGLALLAAGAPRGFARVAVAGAVGLCIVALLLSGGRAGVLGLGATLPVLLLAGAMAGGRGNVLRAIGLALGLGLIIGLALSAALRLEDMPATLQRLAVILEGDIGTNESFLNRAERFAAAGGLFASAPVFGHGTGSWDFVAGSADAHYPHNLVVELLVEQGLAGTLLFALVAGATLVFFLRTARPLRDPTALAVLATAFFVLALVQVTGDLGRNVHLFAVLGLMAGFACRGEPNRWA